MPYFMDFCLLSSFEGILTSMSSVPSSRREASCRGIIMPYSQDFCPKSSLGDTFQRHGYAYALAP